MILYKTPLAENKFPAPVIQVHWHQNKGTLLFLFSPAHNQRRFPVVIFNWVLFSPPPFGDSFTLRLTSLQCFIFLTILFYYFFSIEILCLKIALIMIPHAHNPNTKTIITPLLCSPKNSKVPPFQNTHWLKLCDVSLPGRWDDTPSCSLTSLPPFDSSYLSSHDFFKDIPLKFQE